MNHIKIILAVFGAVAKIKEAIEDDGKIDAGEAIQIVLSLAGGILGADSKKITNLITAVEDIAGEKILTKTLNIA